MPELAAPDLSIARFVIERGLALIYLVAFVVAIRQFPALAGADGLTPCTRLLRALPFRRAPTIFHWRYTDRLLVAASWVGVGIAVALVAGLPQRAPLPVTMVAWLVLWVLYQSIVNIGGTWYGFGWETLLLEAGFLAIFLGNDAIAPPWLVLVGFRWLGFRVEFGAGLIKLRGDRCWRDLTCMDHHHETQPMPNPLSWYAHHAPRSFHRLEVLGNFAAQLVLPFALFLPQPFASIGAALMIATQLYLIVTGNYAWLNWLTLLAMVAAVSDPAIRAGVPFLPLGAPPIYDDQPLWFGLLTVGLAVLIGVLSVRVVRNLISPDQAMNASFDPLHLVNTYGAFGSVSRERYEVIVEGTASARIDDSTTWREYGFPGKPGDVRRRPGQIAPYHLRLDWLLWFVPLSPAYAGDWLGELLVRLLRGERPIRRLLGSDPFPDRPPEWVRVRPFHYRFTTPAERASSGDWWVRRPVQLLVPPMRLSADGQPRFDPAR